MRFFIHIIFILVSSALALFIAVHFVDGFYIMPTILAYFEISVVFTLINVFLRPLLKIVLSPVIILTLGIGIIIVNAISLYVLDFAMDSMTISGLYPLVYATLIISVVNFILGFVGKHLYNKNK